MTFDIEIVLRGATIATTERAHHGAEPVEWDQDDAGAVLKTILLAIDRARDPGAVERQVSLRGFSWIVEPAEGGGVVIAVEIPSGAAVAGPFDIPQRQLDRLISSALAPRLRPSRPTIH